MNRISWLHVLKFFIAIELFPLVYAMTLTFSQSLKIMGGVVAVWHNQPLFLFLAGFAAWVLIFFILPRPMRVYVIGHELTHALWIWAMGGRVTGFKASSEGGHVQTDTVNFLIALAPYFFPIYTVFVVGLYLMAGIFWDLTSYGSYLYFLMGLTWGFHVCFTLMMIPTVQPDITSNGWLFSLVIIYLANVISVWFFMVFVSGRPPLWEACKMLGVNTYEVYESVILWIYRHVMQLAGR